MIASAERLREKAHELALTHRPYHSKAPSAGLRRMAEADARAIRRYLEEMAGCRNGCAEPAEEWLKDHAEFILEQAELAADSIRDAKLDRLPRLRGSRRHRVFALCEAYLELTDGELDWNAFRGFLNAYQEIAVLSMAEIWMMPIGLRHGLIRRLKSLMEAIRERREECTAVVRLLERLEPAGTDAAALARALEEAGRDVPLSGAFAAHLIRHLREWTGDGAAVREWLSCKFEGGTEGFDRIVSSEYRLQSAAHESAGRIIGSLRLMLRWDWRSHFAEISTTERTLCRDPAGDYPRLDHASRDLLRLSVEKLARRFRVPENLVAEHAVALAEEARRRLAAAGGTDERSGPHADVRGAEAAGAKEAAWPRQAFLFYYLLEPKGIEALGRSLRSCGVTRRRAVHWLRKRPTLSYFGWTGFFFAAAAIGLAAWTGQWDVPSFAGPAAPGGEGTGGLFRGFGLAGEAAGATGPSGNMAGLPGGAAGGWTQVLWQLAAALLLAFPAAELAVTLTHGLIGLFCKTSPLLKYDFSEGIPPDAATVVTVPVVLASPEEAREMADRLEMHFLANRSPNLHFALLADLPDADAERMPGDEAVMAEAVRRIRQLNERYPHRPFHLYFRRRTWNGSEGKWMGWERKRGKLVEFMAFARGLQDPQFAAMEGDAGFLRGVRYVITVDADTELPPESAQRMVGAMHLPYNRPRLNRERTRVVEGHAVMQPRIGIRHETALRSRLAYLWSRETGVDPYAFAVSDPYQDLFGHGIYVGKGILDLDLFVELTAERIPENRVLSHDLLEGGFLRTGLLSDILLVDGMPGSFHAHQKRLHRWVRGDWQLLLWLLPKNRDRSGTRRKVDLPAIVRWQILDNLRRSLMAPALMLALLLGYAGLPGSPAAWLAVVLVSVFLPVLRQLAAGNWRGSGLTAAQCLLALVTLPYQAVLMADAILRTLYRLLISRRHLLEWVSMAEVERRHAKRRVPPLAGMAGGMLLAALLAMAAMPGDGGPFAFVSGFALALSWLAAPFAIRLLDRPMADPRIPASFSEEDKEALRRLAADIWSFFERYVTEDDHWLPPDNVQLDPPKGVARRTSPTNIGLYMACVMAARDFGFIGRREAVWRLGRTLETMERMEKWEGHLYNWYDTETLAPLPPRYVSTVDSGNLVVSLMAVRQGVREWLEQEEEAGGEDAGARTWREEAERLAERLDAFIAGTNFRPLYDHAARLFSLGHFPDRGRRDPILYDLLASEARMASFAAIALGQVSVAHWHALGRSLAEVGGRPMLLSWSGTMFEYLMPWLFMRTWRNTIWDSTYRAAVAGQLAHARRHGVPLGVSESGYYAFDEQMNYQYQAFGVPEIGFRKGMETDLVTAPYAAVLALPYAGKHAMEALRHFERLGARGRYGFYEAVDHTKRRLPEGRTHMVVTSYMAHHQGMSLLALANLLLPRTVVDRFHENKEVKAAELLLQERIPARPKFVRRKPSAICRREPAAAPQGADRMLVRERLARPEVHLVGGGRFAVMVTAAGGGYSMFDGRAVTRWKPDPAMEACGLVFYIRDSGEDRVWSPCLLPAKAPADDVRIRFAPDAAEFSRVVGDIRSDMTVCAAPDGHADIRRLVLANRGGRRRVLEVTAFQELALAEPAAFDAHPAFNRLFVRTEYVPEIDGLAAVRRPREPGGRELWAVFGLYAEGEREAEAEFETDRAAFIGRGRSMDDPKGLRERLKGATGAVADPAFVIRRTVALEPGESVTLVAVTAAAEEKEPALEAVRRYGSARGAEQALSLAWHRSQTELRQLRLTPGDAILAQRLAGLLLYPPEPDGEKRRLVAENALGPSGLWPLGISGDKPVVVLLVPDRVHLPFARRLMALHEYLRLRQLHFDLVVLYGTEGGYVQELRDALRREAEHGVERFGAPAAGIHLLDPARLSEDQRRLLLAKARLVLRADGASLGAQLRKAQEAGAGGARPQETDVRPAGSAAAVAGGADGARAAGAGSPAAIAAGTDSGGVRSGPRGHAGPAAAPAGAVRPDAAQRGREDLLFFNGYGGFTRDGTEYRILAGGGRQVPAPWINVIANPSFGCIVSERGTGYTWWRNSREFKLTTWSNDPVLDPPGEAWWIRDEESGALWQPAVADGGRHPAVTVTHGWGYTAFVGEAEGIAHEMTVSVAPDDPVKIIRLALKNGSGRRRRLSVTGFAEWVLGVRREDAGPFLVTEWDGEAKALLVRNMHQDTFRGAVAFLAVLPAPDDRSGDRSAPAEPADWSWTGDRLAFIGRHGDAARPAAMDAVRLDGRTGSAADPCGAVRAAFTLEAGESRDVFILLGCETTHGRVRALLSRLADPANARRLMEETRARWRELAGRVQVATPNLETDLLLNGWLLVQTLGCRLWARTAFYQAGGAYGFRDQLQDSLALLHAAPELTRRQIVLHASRQYEEGDVQHWWHAETDSGIRTRFSDDLLWLPYAVSVYVEHTGDRSILEETAPYLQSAPLDAGEHERYERAAASGRTGTVYEHACRAIDLALSRKGEHGLPLIGTGDWNDGMSMVGDKGRGVSVWLGFFLHDVLRRFEPLARLMGEPGRADRYAEERRRLREALNGPAWDGAWYRRAMTDEGEWLGTAAGRECRIDAIAQSWSVISGAGDDGKRRQAMESLDRELVDRDLALIRLLAPPFEHTDPSPGYIQGYPPGIRENGAQYTHGVLWSVLAWCELGRGDRAFELYRMLNPVNHARTESEVRRYGGEPYVMAADVYTGEPHAGRAGWTWYTGAAGWMYRIGLEAILGIRMKDGKLLVRPCIPPDWPGYSVRCRIGSSLWRIDVHNPDRRMTGIRRMVIDGEDARLDGREREEEVLLNVRDDGNTHQVELWM